jgi:hypothetical protein
MNCILCESASKPLLTDRIGTYYDCPACRGVFLSPEDHPTPDAETGEISGTQQRYPRPAVPSLRRADRKRRRRVIYSRSQGPRLRLRHGAGNQPFAVAENYSLDRYDPFFNADSKVFGRQYDFIVACEVIEHFHDPRGEFARLRNMLNRGGKFLVMTEPLLPSTEFADWYYKNDQTHVFFYRPETFEYIRERFHFDHCSINGRLIELS